LLAIPASSIPSESAFSMARRTINDFRSSLTPKTLEALIRTKTGIGQKVNLFSVIYI
jgi:hypothetical protein